MPTVAGANTLHLINFDTRARGGTSRGKGCQLDTMHRMNTHGGQSGRGRREWGGAIVASLVVMILPTLASTVAQRSTPSAEELIGWLDAPDTAWAASAHLQALPQDALPLLLAPGRVNYGPHGSWSAHMLALAKLGEQAVPAIRQRAISLVSGTNTSISVGSASPLIKVLGAMGPVAAPALVDIAEASETPYEAFQALDEMVGLEPRPSMFERRVSGWYLAEPTAHRLIELQERLTPLLPRIRQLLESKFQRWTISANWAPQRPAAYLLARWGTGDTRARGLLALEALAQEPEPVDYASVSIRLLYALKAPQTAQLIRLTAPRVRDGDLKGDVLLWMAVALRGLDAPDYADFLESPLRDSRPYMRMEAAGFIGSSGDVSLAARLVALLSDDSNWNGETVASVAHRALQRLTLERLPLDATLWRDWLARNAGATRPNLLALRLKTQLQTVRAVPIWVANSWIDEVESEDGAILLPLVDQYLDRPDLNARSTGPNSGRGAGGPGPSGQYGPRVVTLLLEMTQRGVPGAMKRLADCLDAADPEVRVFGAFALAAYDRPRALARLAKEVRGAAAGDASEFLLQLGDKRGIPDLLQGLTSGREARRLFACRDLRVYSQQPLPCDAGTPASERVAQAGVWRSWWKANERSFRPKSREAALDLGASPMLPVRFSGRAVR